MAPKILVVLTSFSKIDSINHETGWYLPEFAHPYEVFEASDAEITVASPKGGVAPLDPHSVEATKEDSTSVSFLSKKALWEQTKPLKEFIGRSGEFDALFYPGGHGPMFDLATDADSIKLINEFYAAGKVVAAVCHGPAVFVNVETPSGPLLKGKEATGFTNKEEDIMNLSSAMPFMLEDAIVKAGAKFVKADEPWGVKVVVDGKVITGQNPASAKGVGEAIIKALA